MDSDPTAFVARYGWTKRTVRMSFTSLIFLAGAFVPGAPLWSAIGIGAFGLVGFLAFAVIAFSRKIVLQIDRYGVTLGGSPLPIGLKTDVVPWDDIVSIVLWTLRKEPYIGLQRKPGAPPLPGMPDGPRLRRLNQILIPYLPGEIVQASRGLGLCQIDRVQLEAAVANFAPWVQVIDIGSK
ncbi:hypothetical protein [Streptomyces sp. NPDC002619]|uniref:hypothetical protein n=1 Tax=Streptomyces sp. NPDC002619 TaxID=3364655 RepID=UPI0036A18541